MYKVRNENKKIPIRVNSNLSLLDAVKLIDMKDGGIVLSHDNRLVAFWCSYHNCIKLGHGAFIYERITLENVYCTLVVRH